VVDLGSSFHATPHRKHFHDYVQGNFEQVCLGDERPLDIIGKCKVMINLENGNQCLLNDVKHVVGLKNNLISIGLLEGCVTTFTNKTWKVTKGAMVVEKGDKVGTLYVWKGNNASSSYLSSPTKHIFTNLHQILFVQKYPFSKLGIGLSYMMMGFSRLAHNLTITMGFLV
jgi:hypothetical protein